MQIYTGDALDVLRSLPAASVHTCVTSPPYFGLRDYGVDGQIGLEETPEAFTQKLVDVFREVRRVLRDDGTLWLNLGDSYNGSGKGGDKEGHEGKQSTNRGTIAIKNRPTRLSTLKPKDLIGIPWRVAFALQADGWYLRQDIIWAKKNVMPESVTDRCTKSHEYMFLLSKSPRYYFDHIAIREPASSAGSVHVHTAGDKMSALAGNPLHATKPQRTIVTGALRNKRDVWHVATRPYKGAHFATFPPDLITPCILAGTSERGCCAACGAPWERVVEKKRVRRDQFAKGDPRYRPARYKGAYEGINGKGDAGYSESVTRGWRPACTCNAPVVPCVVLDPFMGSGTTGYVALKHARDFVGIELNPKYVALAEERIGPLVKTTPQAA